MSNEKDPPIPSDQYERVVEELRMFSLLIDEMQRSVSTAKGQHAIEARRCFARSADRLQESGYWFGQGLKNARKAGN
jgi:hypothetical protein